MRVLITGSRDWFDYPAIKDCLSALAATESPVEVIHGGARGADYYAGVAARTLGLVVSVYPADWSVEPRRAGILRNLQMLDTRPDLVIAFQRNGSRGTQHTVDEAKRRGIPVEVHTA